jgi:hypothetical protein
MSDMDAFNSLTYEQYTSLLTRMTTLEQYMDTYLCALIDRGARFKSPDGNPRSVVLPMEFDVKPISESESKQPSESETESELDEETKQGLPRHIAYWGKVNAKINAREDAIRIDAIRIAKLKEQNVLEHTRIAKEAVSGYDAARNLLEERMFVMKKLGLLSNKVDAHHEMLNLMNCSLSK